MLRDFNPAALSMRRNELKEKKTGITERLKSVAAPRISQDVLDDLKQQVQSKNKIINSLEIEVKSLQKLVEEMNIERNDMVLKIEAMKDQLVTVNDALDQCHQSKNENETEMNIERNEMIVKMETMKDQLETKDDMKLEKAQNFAIDTLKSIGERGQKSQGIQAKPIRAKSSEETHGACELETYNLQKFKEVNVCTIDGEMGDDNILQDPQSIIPQSRKDNLQVIFECCAVDHSVGLDLHEARYALEGVGLFPDKEHVEQRMKALSFTFPLTLHEFRHIVDDLKEMKCKQGRHIVPYARRGLSLKQLKAIQAGLIDSGWLQTICDTFNNDQAKEIYEGKKFAMKTNLYAMNEAFVQTTTDTDKDVRKKVPEKVLKTVSVPNVPIEKCSFAELLNPDGVLVDFFVSHYWGHSFDKTMKALINFSEGVYRSIGKDSPDEVIFWICLFAVNQHNAAEEVGETPEEGPFNAALAQSKHGAVMIVDDAAEPMKRIWCLFEISRAKHFGKDFKLIVEEGILENAGVEKLELISNQLLGVRAYQANASNEMDKLKILHRILDEKWKNIYAASFDYFKSCMDVGFLGEIEFENFDTHICSLIGMPLLTAGLKLMSKEVCLKAIGMGAMVSVDDLKALGVNADIEVETRLGKCGLHILFARMGRLEEMEYVLDCGADIDSKDGEYENTALHWAAEKGQTAVVSVLLDRGAAVDVKNGKYGNTALHYAALVGNTEAIALLLEGCAVIGEKDDDGRTALHSAAGSGHTETAAMLLNSGAAVDDQSNYGWTTLHFAAHSGHTETAAMLLDSGAAVDNQSNDGGTALHFAAQNGHTETAAMLLDSGAAIDNQDNDGRTALHLAAHSGHTETAAMLLDRKAAIDNQDNDGWTALHFAAQSGHTETAAMLLDSGAAVDNQDNDGWTALHYADTAETAETAETLLDRKAGY